MEQDRAKVFMRQSIEAVEAQYEQTHKENFAWFKWDFELIERNGKALHKMLREVIA